MYILVYNFEGKKLFFRFFLFFISAQLLGFICMWLILLFYEIKMFILFFFSPFSSGALLYTLPVIFFNVYSSLDDDYDGKKKSVTVAGAGVNL